MEKYITQLLADIHYATENISWPFVEKELSLYGHPKEASCTYTITHDFPPDPTPFLAHGKVHKPRHKGKPCQEQKCQRIARPPELTKFLSAKQKTL